MLLVHSEDAEGLVLKEGEVYFIYSFFIPTKEDSVSTSPDND